MIASYSCCNRLCDPWLVAHDRAVNNSCRIAIRMLQTMNRNCVGGSRCRAFDNKENLPPSCSPAVFDGADPLARSRHPAMDALLSSCRTKSHACSPDAICTVTSARDPLADVTRLIAPQVRPWHFHVAHRHNQRQKLHIHPAPYDRAHRSKVLDVACRDTLQHIGREAHDCIMLDALAKLYGHRPFNRLHGV